MIKSVRLVNFFSFGDCTIDLESDLNVLVGINGSGKSNFLRAFQLLKAGIDGRMNEQVIRWGGVQAAIQKVNLNKKEFSIFFTLILDDRCVWPDNYIGEITYEVNLILVANNYLVYERVFRPDGKIYLDTSIIDMSDEENIFARFFEQSNGRELLLPKLVFEGPIGFTYLHFFLNEFDLYRGFNTNEDAPMRTSIRATGVDKLLPNGDNMFQVLNATGIKSILAYDAIESGLQDVNEYFQRFRMNVYGQGVIEFYVQENGLDSPIHVTQVSDGTLCYLCLLVALYQSDRGRVITFDEPERNLHPDMLFELAKQLEKASEKSQIILTTHAPGLLNQFPLRAVRVFEKDENNQTIVKKFTEEDFAGWYDEFAPGQMWRNGDLGGNRY